jgi:hemerythrin
MALLEWRDEYSTGIEDVDDEHRDLIDIVNRLHALMLATDSKLTVPAFIDGLIKGVSAHFALEERIMDESGYPESARHREDHERLLDELREFKAAFARAEEVDSVELAMRLEPWFSRHLIIHDLPLHRTLRVH